MSTASPERVHIRTADFDEAVQTMREAFGPVDFRPDEDGATDLSMRAVNTPDVQSSRWTMTGIGGALRDEDDTAEDVYLTGLRLRGSIRVWSRWDDIDTDRPFIYPHLVDSVLDHPEMANLAVSRAVVLRHARALTGIDDFQVRFTGTAPVDAAMEAVWRDAMAFAARTADLLVGHEETTLAQSGLVELIGGLVLRTFPNTTLDAVNSRDVLGPRGGALRRALQHIADNLDRPILVPEVAEAARLSLRGLHAAFRRDLGTTPQAYIRGERIAAVRHDLQGADPKAATVTAIAMRWGFAQPSDFRRRYLAAFGETPDETLSR